MKQEVGFDPIAGTLRLTRELLDGMCALQQGSGTAKTAALREAGLLQGDSIHPRLVPVAETAARPLARLVLDVAGATLLHCDCWIGDRFALVLVGSGAARDPLEATFLSRSLLTAQLARFVALGPRARAKVSDTVEVDAGLLEALLGAGERLAPSELELLVDPLDELAAPWIEVLSILSKGPRSRWRVGVWWNSFDESPAARSLEIVDSEAGMFLVSHVARGPRRFSRVQLRPVTPTQVWRLSSALLPRPEQVSEPLGD